MEACMTETVGGRFRKKANRTSIGDSSSKKAALVLINFITLFGWVWVGLYNKTVSAIDDTSMHGWLPTVVSQPPTPPPLPAKDYTQKRFWTYDEAAPPIRHSRVHFLSSFPSNLRLTLDMEDANNNLTEAFGRYESNPNNKFPQKHHLAEFNPSIARLPQTYLTNEEWLRAFGGRSGSPNMPLYVSTYRISNQHDCYLGGDGDAGIANAIKFNYDYLLWRQIKPKTEFIGFALLNGGLDIIADIIVDFGTTMVFRKNYEDFRVFNLRGGDGEKEHLYVTTNDFIVPIELMLPSEHSTEAITGYKKLLPPPMFGSDSNNPQPKFMVWHRGRPSCLGSPRGKNYLYFDEMTNTATKSATAAAPTTMYKTEVVNWPRGNPNQVMPVDLNEVCNRKRHLIRPSYMEDQEKHPPPQPKPSFQTMDQQLHPGSDLFTPDRGSACCVRIQKDQIPISPSMAEHVKNVSNHNDSALMVAITHMKTREDKRRGVIKNTYLSRFIAFLPHEPYTIVAHSGMFCLGFFGKDAMSSNSPEFPAFLESRYLRFGSERLMNCPRIHFVMSMIEKHKTTQNPQGIANDKSDDSVIISYGISDCYSRFVEVKKTHIVSMFTGNNTNS